MSQEIFCPQCGGLIFSSDPDAMEMKPCTCSAPSRAPATSGSATKAAAAMEAPVKVRRDLSRVASDPDEPATAVEKICVRCGKDVNGHRRLKDDKGDYWCLPCAKEEDRRKKAANPESKSKCALCQTEVHVNNLVTYDGRFVCPKCAREQRELAKTTEARISRVNNAFKGQEWKRLTPLLIVLGICALIILLRWVGLIGT